MKSLIISTIALLLINVCNGLLVLPFKNVPASIAAGDKIGIPISNDKFIISNCAALGNSYLYTENNEVTEYSPVAYFRDATTLELYVPDVGTDTSKKYFIVVELPLAEAIIKTDSFTVTPGTNINLPTTDGCGKTVRFSNKEKITNTVSGNVNIQSGGGNGLNTDINGENGNDENNVNAAEGNGNNTNDANGNNAGNNNNNNNGNNVDGDNQNKGKIGDSKSNILTAENTSNTAANNEDGGSSNAVIIACAGTSVVALVVISGLVFMRGKSYMKGEEDISYSKLNYMNPKPYNPVGGLYDNLTNSQNDEFDRDYQLRCLQNDNHSQVSCPVSLSDGSCVNMDKTTDIFEADDDVPLPNLPRSAPVPVPVGVPISGSNNNTQNNAPNANTTTNDLPITKHVVEEIVINPEKVLSETINSNAVSAVVTTASVALAINEIGDLTIDNSNLIIEKPSSIEKSNTTTTTTSSCSSCSSCSCSTCSCDHSGSCSCSCSCSCAETSKYTSTTNNESSLKLLSLDLNNTKPFTSMDFTNNQSAMGDTTRGYSVFVDNDNKKDSMADVTTYTETNYDDSRRMTNYTETNYDDSSRRDTQYTETNYDDSSRRDTQYTDYTVDSRRDTQYTDYTVDSRRDTQYTDYTVDSRRDTQYTDYTVDSRRDTQYTYYTVDDSRRNTQYTDYTEGSSYTTDRDSRRYTNYTEGSSYTTNRDSRYTDYTEGSSYSSCSCSGSECECSRRNTQYSEYTSYTTDATDSRRFTGSEYTTDYDSKRQTYTTDYSTSQYSSDFCEAHDASESESSRILPLSTIEPFGGAVDTSSFLDVLQSKQSAIRESICGLLPTGPISGKPPKFDIEFVAQNDLEAEKPGELTIKKMNVIRIVENLDGGYYMATNSSTGASGKIPAYKILSLL